MRKKKKKVDGPAVGVVASRELAGVGQAHPSDLHQTAAVPVVQLDLQNGGTRGPVGRVKWRRRQDEEYTLLNSLCTILRAIRMRTSTWENQERGGSVHRPDVEWRLLSRVWAHGNQTRGWAKRISHEMHWW